jgi:hypothetical protein
VKHTACGCACDLDFDLCRGGGVERQAYAVAPIQDPTVIRLHWWWWWQTTPTNSVPSLIGSRRLTRRIRYVIDPALILFVPSLVDGDASPLYF